MRGEIADQRGPVGAVGRGVAAVRADGAALCRPPRSSPDRGNLRSGAQLKPLPAPVPDRIAAPSRRGAGRRLRRTGSRPHRRPRSRPSRRPHRTCGAGARPRPARRAARARSRPRPRRRHTVSPPRRRLDPPRLQPALPNLSQSDIVVAARCATHRAQSRRAAPPDPWLSGSRPQRADRFRQDGEPSHDAGRSRVAAAHAATAARFGRRTAVAGAVIAEAAVLLGPIILFHRHYDVAIADHPTGWSDTAAWPRRRPTCARRST